MNMDFTTKSYLLGEFKIDCGLINEYDRLELQWPISVTHEYTFGDDTVNHSVNIADFITFKTEK